MSVGLIISAISLGLLDSLNPATIATMIMLLPIVKKKWHSLIFAFGTFVVYLSVGLIVYFGGDNLIKSNFGNTMNQNSFLLSKLELVFGIAVLAYGAFHVIKLIQKIRTKKIGETDYMSVITRVVSPLTLLLFAVTATLTDITTAFPYFGFIAMLTVKKLSLTLGIGLFIVYCLIYISPMLVLYSLFSYIKREKFEQIEISFKRFINIASEYALPIILLVFGYLLTSDALSYL